MQVARVSFAIQIVLQIVLLASSFAHPTGIRILVEISDNRKPPFRAARPVIIVMVSDSQGAAGMFGRMQEPSASPGLLRIAFATSTISAITQRMRTPVVTSASSRFRGQMGLRLYSPTELPGVTAPRVPNRRPHRTPRDGQHVN
jgi:hypothetical protein